MALGLGKIRAQPHRWWIIALSAAAMMLAFMDRAILPLFVEQIKADLHITDVQFSLLTGLAFTLMYSLCGLPIGMLIDRASRPKIIAAGMLVWSLATSLTGFGRSFTHVFLARVAVGMGESTVSPGSQSMAADMFMGNKLARAMSAVSLGTVIGNGSALIVGGGLAALFGHRAIDLPVVGPMHAWQMVFLLLGLPGFILAPVLFLFVEDPPRRRVAVDASGQRGRSNFLELFRFVGQHRTTVAFNISGYIFCALGSLALQAWTPAHMIRVFHLAAPRVGITLGICQLFASSAGLMIGGWWIDRKLESGQLDGAMQLSRNTALMAIPALFGFALSPSFPVSVACAVTAQTLIALAYSVSSISHNPFTPNQIRAQFSVCFLFLATTIGGVVGPSAAALLNRSVFVDPARIGLSAALVASVSLLVGGTLLTLGLKPYRRSIAAVIAQTRDAMPAGA